MFNFFKRKKKNPVLLERDGREMKYVTRRFYNEKGSPEEEIVGQTGRIVCIDGEIRILCGETDVFKGREEDCEYFRLLSGNGITVSGFNTVIGKQDNITVYYKYHR
jgi:hypothetical protein